MANTDILPAEIPVTTLMVSVPCPPVIIHPVGTVHKYPAAPVAPGVLYETGTEAQTVLLPVTEATGACGALKKVGKTKAALVSHALKLRTATLPVSLPIVTEIAVSPC